MNNITTEESIKNAIAIVSIMCFTCKKTPAEHDCGTCCVAKNTYATIIKLYKTEFREKLDKIIESIDEWKLNTMVSMDDVKREINRIKNSL